MGLLPSEANHMPPSCNHVVIAVTGSVKAAISIERYAAAQML